MKPKYLLLTFLLFSSLFNLTAQEVTIKKSFGENLFSQNDKRISFNQLLTSLENNSEAYKMATSAKGNKTFGMILGTAGGALIGWPLGTAIGGGEPNWILAGVGAGLVVATIPIISGYNKKTAKAVQLYNDGLTDTSYKPVPVQLYISASHNGLGINVQF